jgi:MYXO-CTERM domain-containing protein
MKRSNLFKILGISILSLGTAIMPLTLPASAQVTQPETDRTVVREDDGFDWGWLGLLGLLGLAGLAGKSRREPTAYREPDVTARTTYRE